MVKVLKLAALFPDHLNLNGDHGNLLVVQKRLQWSGFAAEIIPVTSTANLSEFDFVLIGHGSKAAWDDVLRLDHAFVQNVVTYVESGKTALVIASAYDLISDVLMGKANLVSEHKSLFVKTPDGVVGYLNTASVSEQLQWYRKTLLTQLHGPILVKNPKLADRLIEHMGVTMTGDAKEFAVIEELAEASRRLAFES